MRLRTGIGTLISASQKVFLKPHLEREVDGCSVSLSQDVTSELAR
jgi:hypothetical protein